MLVFSFPLKDFLNGILHAFKDNRAGGMYEENNDGNQSLQGIGVDMDFIE